MSKLITTSSELWKEIVATAQFQHKEYDMDMLQQLRGLLSLPASGSMGALLKKHDISCEDLLDAVLCCMMPFTQMLQDILALFRQAGAQQGDHNLKICFDFNSEHEMFNTDLSAFRQQVQTAGVSISRTYVDIPDHPYELVRSIEQIWKIDHVNDPEVLYPEEIREWLAEYDRCSFGTWPDHDPPRPSTGFAELDVQINRLWKILRSALWKYRNEYSPDLWENVRSREDQQFWFNETDRWIGALIRSVCDLLLYFKAYSPDMHAAFADFAAGEIRRVLEECPATRFSLDEMRRAVLDILNLPFWKKRYEMYSVWVSTQILNALPDKNVHYHVQDNTLSFSFAGSHIATLGAYDPPLELWAEVRTYYDSPKGASRKNHIQPDYTLAVGDAYDVHHSVAVVECKQYKKYSRKNFLNAAEDYAGGRPEASVFLVNYGTIKKTLADSVDEKYQHRIQFHGFIRPAAPETMGFRKALRAAIDQYYAEKYTVRLPQYTMPAGKCAVRLQWDAAPNDLDLHLEITSDDGASRIFFNQRGSLHTAPYAYLYNDDKSGFGDEIIGIWQWMPGRYDIYVVDYHNTETIHGEMTVLIEIDGMTKYAISRTEPIERGKAWHPYTITSGKIIPVNDIVDNP